MIEKVYKTEFGDIRYYVNTSAGSEYTLVFLPGLTADHTLFDKQIEYFENKYSIIVWDAPGHCASRPFDLRFELEDKVRWLNEILKEEKIEQPVFVGQSMGGYVTQAFCQYIPGRLKGCVIIDSAPLQQSYSSRFDLFFMEHAETMYKMYPWKSLLNAGSKGVAETKLGQQNMYDMMSIYSKDEYCKLVGHGYRMLAKAIKADLPYKIDCPVQIICGKNDKAGLTRKYNERWISKEGYPIAWIENAGHNSNADKPEEINTVIENFIATVKAISNQQ